MRNTDTLWSDVAWVLTIFAVGGILFVHFEEHEPKARRLVKVALVTAVTVGWAAAVFRWADYGFLGAIGVAVAYVHIFWLPSHGVSGWTGEPKERYCELLRERRRGKPPRAIVSEPIAARHGTCGPSFTSWPGAGKLRTAGHRGMRHWGQAPHEPSSGG
jgi:hypothetical protein